jgi:hypothetical protein
MQLSAAPGRKLPPAFINHTPRLHEAIELQALRAGPNMIPPAGMAFAAGPLYTNALMGQAPSIAEREQARKASSTILREDSIRIESETDSQSELWSIHQYVLITTPGPIWLLIARTKSVRTDQAPYNDMNTQHSLTRLPRENASYDLSQFLRKTGPPPPHRRPSGSSRSSTSRNGRGFFRSKQKQRDPPAIELGPFLPYVVLQIHTILGTDSPPESYKIQGACFRASNRKSPQQVSTCHRGRDRAITYVAKAPNTWH